MIRPKLGKIGLEPNNPTHKKKGSTYTWSIEMLGWVGSSYAWRNLLKKGT